MNSSSRGSGRWVDAGLLRVTLRAAKPTRQDYQDEDKPSVEARRAEAVKRLHERWLTYRETIPAKRSLADLGAGDSETGLSIDQFFRAEAVRIMATSDPCVAMEAFLEGRSKRRGRPKQSHDEKIAIAVDIQRKSDAGKKMSEIYATHRGGPAAGRLANIRSELTPRQRREVRATLSMEKLEGKVNEASGAAATSASAVKARPAAPKVQKKSSSRKFRPK
jgi:hypothetical protein